jgi:hypothetical protein
VPFVAIQLVMVGLVMTVPSLAIPSKATPLASLRAIEAPGAALESGRSPVPRGGFFLPPTPPSIDGMSAPETAPSNAPVLDLSVPPNFDAEERALPRREN